MRNGHPLTDEDRWPWLDCLRKQIEQLLSARENAVLACSALKRAYRERLRVSDDVKFVFLRGDYAVVEKQLRSRHRHFMNANLLQSQFDDLEEPQPDDNVLTIELDERRRILVKRIKAKLNLHGQRLARCERFGTARLDSWCQEHEMPAAIAQNINSKNPATKDPVSARKYPNAYGPAKPARLASALIVPTATAALESLRISVGIAQNTGRNAMAMQMKLNSKTVVTFELGKLIRHKNPAAPMNSGNAACQRLSRSLSECHPLNNIVKSATK